MNFSQFLPHLNFSQLIDFFSSNWHVLCVILFFTGQNSNMKTSFLDFICFPNVASRKKVTKLDNITYKEDIFLQLIEKEELSWSICSLKSLEKEIQQPKLIQYNIFWLYTIKFLISKKLGKTHIWNMKIQSHTEKYCVIWCSVESMYIEPLKCNKLLELQNSIYYHRFYCSFRNMHFK